MGKHRQSSLACDEDRGKTSYAQIYGMIRQIPEGKVATYGQIAGLVGRCTPRMVGYALAALPAGRDVPWHRVINARGEISRRSGGDGEIRQRMRLEAEGIRFDPEGRLDLKKVRWVKPGTGPRRKVNPY
jgi:methylated-DNA-protein-cysteine methyltransferase related protein